LGTWRISVFDQWNDMLVDGLSTPVALTAANPNINMGQIAINQWQANIYTRTFFDQNGDGVSNVDAQGKATEPGLALVATNIRFRDGSFSNFNNTDLNGFAGFNEVFPLFSWYVVETDTTRYKSTGIHVVYDAGGPPDGTPCGPSANPPTAPCGASSIGNFLANTAEDSQVALPANLRVPGSVYCDNGDCKGFSITNGPGSSKTGSTGRIDPPWAATEGWQGFSGQNSFIEFGKKPYATGENGGIRGHVIYASTRPFDDPQLLLQTSWEPLVPGVTINLYQEGTAPDGSTSLVLVDTTKTSSFDDWGQGFRSDGLPNMNCPGQYTDKSTPSDLFYYSLYNQPDWLDEYNNGGTPAHTLPNNSQFKCYDGMHNWNQIQPAPYDGLYQFPSIAGRNPQTGVPTGGTGSVAGTNCSICVANPTDSTPMLPIGKYVVEVVVPPGYELVKEEDKNILIGDNYIAPATQEFGGLGNVFILPDQAEIDAYYNANNPQNPTQNLGSTNFPRHEADTGSMETYWPCVGSSRVVPDFISLFPGSKEVSPFAGATRNLCDRKEVTLQDQSAALAKFYIFTSTHAAAHFTGVITDDFTSEFDPFSPSFGEKFAPPNLPISIKDFNGNEVARTYTDHWGAYNGLNYSTWEVNPPNPTGYAPTMMVTCMNDPGPIPDGKGGTMVDPLFNPQYSQFCYEIPFMPGQTQYMDTPVVPSSAFAGAGYNNPDCAYPDATPAIKEVDGDGVGPWVSASGKTLTINALGDQLVPNNAYAGPSQTTPPYNQKKINRHYGFGNTAGTVTIGGVAATISSWSDTQIKVRVPSGVPNCAVQQQSLYAPGATTAQCGELVIQAANGKQSIDSVTVTIGGKAPTIIASGTTIQSAIDAASPGDLIIVPAGAYSELVLMWKPVRLQGVGGASSVINANTHPAGKLDPWRKQVLCLFGLGSNGTPPADPGCGANWNSFGVNPKDPIQVDRLPLEAVVGWNATYNGNLAEQLQEPTILGAYEGAGITVLAKGVNFNGGDPFSSDAFPTGTTLLTTSDCSTWGRTPTNPYPSNFLCNPSRIDGLGVTNSSQGGGGIFVHAWAHNLEVANNRVYNNSGTLAGGIAVGQGEFPDQYLQNGTTPALAPGSCQTSSTDNTQLPYCFNMFVSVHNNDIALNSSLGDELFSSTPSGAGGAVFCMGADYYKFNYNWVCGNLSSGDGGGISHLGFTYNGDIEHNSILFNQSTNPTVPANGGGLAVVGAPDTDPVCGIEFGNPDADCAPGTSDGTGPGLVINANLFMGNAAESGSGGAIRLHGVNGTELTFFPTSPSNWYTVNVTNNIIVNNVSGWDGAGVSLQDALAVNLINNTIASNDSTGSAGVLFNTLGAPLSGSPGSNCIQSGSTTASCPQVAGLVTTQHSPTLLETLAGRSLTCPTGHPNCAKMSYPVLDNDLFWQNRSFYIGVGSLGSGGTNQQNVVALYNAFGPQTPANQAVSQPQADAVQPNGNGVLITGGTGACVSPASFWDIGVRGDAGPSNHNSGFTLAPTYSVVTDAADYPGLNNSGSNPTLGSQYCNGSRVPPELGSMGYQVPPGISDATVPNPIFNLTPAATVDEGNNWINLSWGPLAMTQPVNGSTLGNYAPAANSPAINYIPNTASTYAVAPPTDFFGNPRPTAPGAPIDVGAVEIHSFPPTLTSISPTSGLLGTSVPVTLTGTNFPTTGTTTLNVSGTGVTVSNVSVVSATQITATFTITAGATLRGRNVTVTTIIGTTNSVTFTVQGATLTSIAPTSGTHGTTVAVTLTGTNLTGASAITVTGGGITVTGLTVVNSTTVKANFVITSGALQSARNVSVTTPIGTAKTVTFTVN
jgi:hypothetical protein